MVLAVWFLSVWMHGQDGVDRMLCMMMKTVGRGWMGLGSMGVGLMGFVAMVGCGHEGAPAASQPAAAMAPIVEVMEIHVNQDCLILQDQVDGVMGVRVPGATAAGGQTASGQATGGQTDTAVCHLESQLTSNHVKGEVVNGAVQRSVVVVKEQEYLLQDEFETPVVFVVEQAVPDGWMVDSDPQPTKVEGKVALFRVTVQPGQIARLHVGEQHTIPLAQ
jgi:hypothetical protein